MVETGCWGRYLGRVDLRVTPRAQAAAAGRRSVELVSYALQQVDRTPEDPAMVASVERLEQAIEGRMGRSSTIRSANATEISRNGTENLMGNLATDAYRAATHADIALDQVNIIYGELHDGPVRPVDVFNANPAIYNPAPGKSWTLQTLNVTGRKISAIFNFLFSSHAASLFSSLAVSGVQMLYDPTLESNSFSLMDLVIPGTDQLNDAFHSPAMLALKIGGAPLDLDRTYRVAMSGGIVHALEDIDEVFSDAIPLDGLADTGRESWRVVADSIHAKSPIVTETIASAAASRPFSRTPAS